MAELARVKNIGGSLWESGRWYFGQNETTSGQNETHLGNSYEK